uniref:Reverse transcriptase zinc-binding domain-containing protein n=1 Tax=Cannabis sativa TaxID=3483 RepID=A0A803Q9B4_CANSA
MEKDNGTKMFQIVTKLKGLKPKLKQLNHQYFADIPAAHGKAKMELDDCQKELHKCPLNAELQVREAAARTEFATIQDAYLSFLQQKAKILWLKDGDSNSAFYHNSIRARRSQNQILSIMDSNGVRVDNPHQISTLFLEYYNQILGSKMVNRKSVLEGVMRQGEKKHWPSVVWSRLNCPKHSFIFWLTILQRLKTKDRVKRYNPQIDSGCVLCNNSVEESVEHLFFDCSFTRECFELVKQWLGWRTSAKTVDRIVIWLGKTKCSKFKRAFFVTLSP